MYRRNVYSQNGEDGVIEEILRRLQIDSDWFCEFGAWDGKYLSNTYALVQRGWKGVEIEADHERYRDLLKTAAEHPGQLHTIEAFISPQRGGPNSLDRLLSQTPISREFALLSVDIDSSDYLVWESLDAYSPKVVVIEIDSSLPPGVEFIYTAAKPRSSSFTSTLQLGQGKGYTLACHTGNMIFVRNDLVSALRLPQRDIDDPNRLFDYRWVPLSAGTFFKKLRQKVLR